VTAAGRGGMAMWQKGESKKQVEGKKIESTRWVRPGADKGVEVWD